MVNIPEVNWKYSPFRDRLVFLVHEQMTVCMPSYQAAPFEYEIFQQGIIHRINGIYLNRQWLTGHKQLVTFFKNIFKTLNIKIINVFSTSAKFRSLNIHYHAIAYASLPTYLFRNIINENIFVFKSK